MGGNRRDYDILKTADNKTYFLRRSCHEIEPANIEQCDINSINLTDGRNILRWCEYHQSNNEPQNGKKEC